jgi:hypothetical protein
MDPFDELAALFLSDQGASPRANGASARATMELLIVGHLPVRAGVWLAPYADTVARTEGDTALIRLDDSVAHLQLLRASGDELQAPDTATTLRSTLASLRSSIDHWIVRPPSDAAAEELVTAGADRITILSGVDEAALVAAYQLVKELAAAAEQAGVTLPRLGLAMLGCDEAAGKSAAARLNQTTRSFLGLELGLVLCLPRMDAGLATSSYRRFLDEPCPRPRQLFDWLTEAVPPGPSARPVAPPMSDRNDEPAPVEVAPPPPRPLYGASTPAPGAEPVPTGVPSESWVRRRTVRLKPKAQVEVEPKSATMPREPDEHGQPVALAEHVAGLTTLPIRCPGRERVELAVTAEGWLHLLGRESALREMQVVARWVVDHRELIAMACPQVAVDVRRAPRLHIFTDEPLSVSDLHTSDICLHVLAPVRVGDQVGWYSAPLNGAGQ